jgi:CBS domain-containing protein
MIARATLSQSLMTEKLARRDVTVPSEYRPDPMTTTRVREVMTTEVATLPAAADIADALRHFAEGGHSAYPIVDDEHRCVGIVARSDLLAVPENEPTPLGEAFGGDVLTVAPGDTVLTALHRMLEGSVDHLAVVADGRLTGICTRTDVLRARARLSDFERRQPGWIARLRLDEG